MIDFGTKSIEKHQKIREKSKDLTSSIILPSRFVNNSGAAFALLPASTLVYISRICSFFSTRVFKRLQNNYILIKTSVATH